MLEDSASKMAADGQNNEQKENVPAAMQVKHPLQNSWTFWFYKNDKSKPWDQNLLEITTFSTVEDFWALYNHIELISHIPQGCDYCVFKKGVKPMWEDEANINGGRWLISLNKQSRAQELDNSWLELLLLLIGEGFEEQCDDICGAVVNVRQKGDKIALWTADASSKEANLAIGRTMKQRLHLNSQVVIGYNSHQETAHKHSSATKPKYTV
ncbi:eukaryotic translation initiation factor 4E-like isoform X1 [Varroa jacobsoni]|uniref:eIF-4F 25 kDa subunit n=2 Tax=Varroa destructor TaxID=109461 RepID=A0A7M7J1F9_VARDE|nr:eukaryotic translation initiation factor 4E-like isoform X1 [Varroa destructor]XP_022699729.1 eukaryotic translation initiation factor 4E-like isoform X1 [Varroa jacobsoni]